MKLVGRDRKLARWFFIALTAAAVISSFVWAVQAFLAHELVPGFFCALIGSVLLVLQVLQLRNPSWPSRLW